MERLKNEQIDTLGTLQIEPPVLAQFANAANLQMLQITNPVQIVDNFNNHLVSVAEKTRAVLNYSHKHFSEYMENNSSKSFFLSPTNKNEISSIISSLNQNKSVNRNNIPTMILKLLEDEISSHFSDIYNIYFLYGCIPISLKNC